MDSLVHHLSAFKIDPIFEQWVIIIKDSTDHIDLSVREFLETDRVGIAHAHRHRVAVERQVRGVDAGRQRLVGGGELRGAHVDAHLASVDPGFEAPARGATAPA